VNTFEGLTMCDTHRRQFIASSLALTAAAPMLITEAVAAADAANEKKVWICPPCGCPSDTHEFSAAGRCPSCDMELIQKLKSDRAGQTGIRD
jgi:rubrerythrin